jgi:hypothetical protein
MNEHNEILPLLAAYHDGALAHTHREAILSHLNGCVSCRRRLADWTFLDSALLQLPVAERATDEMHGRAMARIDRLAGVSAPVPERASHRIRIWTVATAAVLLFGLATTLIWQREKPLSMAEGGKSRDQLAQEGDALKPEPRNDADRKREADAPGVPAAIPAESAGHVAEGAPELDQVKAAEPKTVDRGADEESRLASRLTAQKGYITAPVPVVAGDSGIPQSFDWPARYYDSITIATYYRYPVPEPILELAELNVVPQFEAGFVGIGYRSLADGLNPQHEAVHTDPIQLSPETSYLVSNLRLEQTSLMARTPQGTPTADVALRLAEITWRLANLTADGDDVKNAIAAQNLASRYRPELAQRSQNRVATLQALAD